MIKKILRLFTLVGLLVLSSCNFDFIKKEYALSISSNPYNTHYVVGDHFNKDGLRVIDQDNNIVESYLLSITNGTILEEVKDYTVEVSKPGYKSAYFNIYVSEKQDKDKIDKSINIYYINDTHGAFIRQNTESNYYEAGMSYIGAYLKDKKADNPNGTIILSGGDMFQGGYESNETRGAIMIDAMNDIGFDAMALGNHEFDWGESYVEGFAESLDCPIISANTFYSGEEDIRPDYLKPYEIITRDDLKIGIIGAAEKNLGSSITGSISENFKFPDPVNYVKQYSRILRTDLHCDLVVTVFHDGGFYDSGEFKFDALTQLDTTTGLKYVDGMFFAHDHRTKAGVKNDVPYLESGCNGRNIGTMTFNFTYSEEDEKYNVTYESPSNMYAYTYCTESDPYIDTLPEKYADVLVDPDKVLYTFKHSYTKEEFTVIICQAMVWFVNSHKSLFGNVTVYFGSHNTGGVRVSTIPEGELTYRELVSITPFDNALCIQRSNSSQLSYMENSSYYRTYRENDVKYDSQGLTNAVTIEYIAETSAYYQAKIQVSYTKYEDYTAKYALIKYLENNIDPNL